MNTSAKITTGTFLAAMALGAASLIACTVSSTSSTDTDGGTSSSGGSSGSTTSSGGSSGSTTDGGGDDAGEACEGLTGKTYSFSTVDTPNCDTCIVEKCCTEVKACFGHTVTQPNVDCNVYSQCVADCNNDADAGADCYDNCDAATDQSIPTQYDTITTCGKTNCATECGF